MTRHTRRWVEGLLQAGFNGASATFGVMMIDPTDFGLLDPVQLKKTIALAGLVAGVNLLQYLARTPLPEMTVREGSGNPAAVIVRSVDFGRGSRKGTGGGKDVA